MDNHDHVTPSDDEKDLPEFLTVNAERLALYKRRLAAQFEMAIGESIGTALDHIQPGEGCGLALIRTMLKLNKQHDIALSFGEHIIRSEQEQGYWCNGFGWVSHPDAATGYTWKNPLAGFPPDARHVSFATAKAFELDSEPA